MTIDEAIKILQEHIEWCDVVKEVDTFKALKLGIEALRCILNTRDIRSFAFDLKLPGETK